MFATGQHPVRSAIRKPPVFIRYCAPKWVDNIKAVILKKILSLVKREDLEGGKFENAWSEQGRTLRFKNGSLIRFFSYEQDINVFGGDDIDAFYMDEHAPYPIYLENMARTIDRNGYGVLTMTPEAGITWEEDVIVNSKDPGIDFRFFSTFDNPHLSRDGIAELEKALGDDILKEAKLYGRFVALAGLVYSNYNPNINFVPYRTLPSHLSRTFSINPHLRIPTTWNVGVWHEGICHIELEGSFEPGRGGITELKAAIRTSLMQLPKGAKIGLWIGDEAMGGDGLNVFGQKSVLAQLAEGQDGFPIIPTNQSSDKAFEAGVMRVREMLNVEPITQKPRLYIMRNCPNTHREFLRWQFREKTKIDEQLLREHVQTVNKEWLDNVRYIVMAEPIATGTVTVQGTGAKDPFTGW